MYRWKSRDIFGFATNIYWQPKECVKIDIYINYKTTPHHLIQHHTSCITLKITPHTEFHAKSNVCIKTNVTTFMGRWYVYGKLLHSEKCMAPVNVTTHPQCTNGKSYKTFGVVIDNFRYQLDIKRRFVSTLISTCILGTVVVIKSMKYDG